MTRTLERMVSDMGNLSDVVETKGIAEGIKLYTKGMSSEEIASSLQLELGYAEDAIASYEND